MTPLALTIAVVVSLIGSGAVVFGLLRTRLRIGETMSLTFDTTPARARQGWSAFWARDPFVQAQMQRQGLAFGTYAVPGRDGVIATHLAENDVQQHTLILGATGSGKSSLLETLALYHLRKKQGFALIDLHGDLFTRVAAWAIALKPKNLVLLDFTRPVELHPTDVSLESFVNDMAELARPLAETANRLGRTDASVAGLLHRGLKTLRGLISPGG